MEDAHQRLPAELAALPEDALATINADVPTVVSMIKAALPGLAALRPQIATLSGYDLVAFDKLQDYADALAFVHAQVRRSEGSAGKLPDMDEEALAFREAVLNVSRGLVSLGLLDANDIPNLPNQGRVQGYRSIGYELMGICSAMLSQLPRLSGRCLIHRGAARARQGAR